MVAHARAIRDYRTLAEDIVAHGRPLVESIGRVRLPSPHYQKDPVAFFREILGVEPWEKQIEIIEAVRDNEQVAVSAGQKVSKSHTFAGLALWYYSSWPKARVVLTSKTSRQVDAILWRELRMMVAGSGKCVDCKRADPEDREPRPCPHSAIIKGRLGELARTGLRSDDFREIFGFTAREEEAIGGISGSNMLFGVDEASGVGDPIFEAIQGNRAGGGVRLVMFANPTKTSGFFFDAFHRKSDFWKTIRVSSLDTPNVKEGKVVIPGLATREFIAAREEEYGRESPWFKVRVLGEFALNEDGKIFSIAAIAEAQDRWDETPADGRLFLGVDPAGESGTGDEAVFLARRGLKHLQTEAKLGLTEDGHLAHALGMIQALRVPRETPVLVLDREGAVGSRVYGRFASYLQDHPGAFELVAVRSSDRAVRQPYVYDRLRDELCASLEGWIREGGAILADPKLEVQMHAMEWYTHAAHGRLKLLPKDKLRKELGRSPDHYDALALACWEPLSLREDAAPQAKRRERRGERPSRGLDPYASVTGRSDRLDPYAGLDPWGDDG